MREYIEREELAATIDRRLTELAHAAPIYGEHLKFYLFGKKHAIDCVYSMHSADVVEVVRCKDCKFFIPDAELDHNEYPNIIEADGLCDNSLKFTYADEFCSYGERKEV